MLFRSTKTDNDAAMERIGNSTIFIGSTPRGIRRQHFQEMSDALGFSSEVDLAKAVIDASENERREMLKRYYVGINPVLSGLSSFTETSSVEEKKEKHVGKGAKRSLESARKDFGHGTSKRSKRSLQKRKSKLSQDKSYASNACEEGFEGQKSPRLVNKSTSRGTNLHLATTLKDKQRSPSESSGNASATNEVKANSFNSRNCVLAEAGPNHLPRTNVMEPKDVKCKSTTSKSDKDLASETQRSYLENTSAFSVSILDDFLMSDSSRAGTEMKGNGRKMDKWKQRNSVKGGKQLDKEEETTSSKLKKSPTSLLDEFI